MDTIRTLIVDDEPLARENLRIRLRDIGDFRVVGECRNGREAVAAILSEKPDLLFLDIRMPDMDGFAVIEQIPPEIQPAIVFVTAYDRYAIDAFRFHALDYILKPFDEERFAETLEVCRQRIAEMRRLGREPEPLFRLADGSNGDAPAVTGSERGASRPYLDRLVIKSRGRVFFLRIQNLDWIEAYGDYVRLHAGERSYLLRRTMNEMEARLDPRAFARLSRSAIVNLDRVKELLPLSRGEHSVRLTDGRELKLTRTFRAKLEALLGDRL
jgi:two-component system, LytTR family, response regulator